MPWPPEFPEAPATDDAEALIRFHERLLFLRAYPPDERALELAERQLRDFPRRIDALRRAGGGLAPFEEPEVSGIAGTSFSAIFSFATARWLARAHPNAIEIDWDRHARTSRLGSALSRFIPLLDEDAQVEPHPPYLDWLRAARGGLGWFIRQLEDSGLSFEHQCELYDSLELPLCWSLGSGPAARTFTRIPVREIFYHDKPLLKRSDVSLDAELTAPPLPLERLSSKEGGELLALARDTSAVRYRELHGFSHGDPGAVWRAPSERGVDIFLWGVPPARRLPLRAYHAGMMFKNGVPVGYVEFLSLFERAEAGFNLYYTFREGETAWLYARLLRLFRHFAGVTRFSIDPYQIGHENDEAIDSGAFWFYRKLGFRPVVPAIARLTAAEERKLAATPGYRTPPRTLRRLAAGSMIYEAPGVPTGDWDRFSLRNLGFAVNRRLTEQSEGGARTLRERALRKVERAIGYRPAGRAEEGMALVASCVSDLASWSSSDREALARVLKARSAREETRYLAAMRRHPRLRAAVLALGSGEEPKAADDRGRQPS
jgi:hypothetical protein